MQILEILQILMLEIFLIQILDYYRAQNQICHKHLTDKGQFLQDLKDKE